MATPSTSAASTGPPSASGPSTANEREQKALESAVESMAAKANEAKNSIVGLIGKIEHDPSLNWPKFLDSYTNVTSQLNTLLKIVKVLLLVFLSLDSPCIVIFVRVHPVRILFQNERTPMLKKYICLPLTLSQDRDEDLLRLTEGRVATFGHDLVPDYLRTKPDPEVEQKHASFEARAGNVVTDSATKQLTAMEKIVNAALKTIAREREEIESKTGLRTEYEKSCNAEDSIGLVAAVTYGRGLRSQQGPPPLGPPPPQGVGGPPQMRGMNPMASQPKAPSSIKTNIKAGAQVHPYNR